MASMLHSQDGPDKFLLTNTYLTGCIGWFSRGSEPARCRGFCFANCFAKNCKVSGIFPAFKTI